ncbi:transporter substrate-binding domain-containing protein [Colibacter massiliensis]|uniref:transporter substrate-binding domain-containing protein n=1 Tax=Colibacter massiliensis TaxID=1852379 RepID=UPI003F8F8AD0
MKKRVLCIAMALSVAVAALTGCGSNSDGGRNASEERTITIATTGTNVPYTVVDENGKWTGIDGDIWNELAKRKGWRIELKRAAFDSLFGELDTRRADLAANAFAVKKERTDKYYASIPYYGDAQSVVVKEGSDIKNIEDLRGRTIGITNGQASQTIIMDMAKEYNFNVKTYEESDAGLLDVALGRIDAQACAVTTARMFMEKTGNKLTILDKRLKANNVAYFFPKKEDGAKLRDEVNEELKKMLDDGTIAKITEKYFGSDMTKYIINE